MNKIIKGNCLDSMKLLEDNSVDAVVTDPPYGLSFMGKKWDYDVPSVEIWKECLRVLKPGGYLLSFAGTRTQHRMAVRIEDAGFEIRDMIAWVYGSGFPKSLNIGKAVDKLQGNERENLGVDEARAKRLVNQMEHSNPTGTWQAGKRIVDITKGTSEWEGWGTALKPALEPITVARKPLSDGGLDIAKTICYNIGVNDLIWRIKLVKPAKKQKAQPSSISTELPKTVEVSVKTVSEKETHYLGKEIENLLVLGRKNTGTIIKSKSTKTAELNTEQTKNEYLQTQEHTNTNESNSPLMPMEESVSVVEKQSLSSLPLTISEVVEDNTENQSKTQTSISTSKSLDTQKTDIDYSAPTATFQWVCMDIVRIVKVKYQDKEYDFEQLSDGSFIWNEELKPFIEPKSLNVAENVLKWGTGGINIDGSRVRTTQKETDDREKWNKYANKEYDNGGTGYDEILTKTGENSLLGRFPANLIHDNSEEVRECFPESKSTGGNGKIGLDSNVNLGGGNNYYNFNDSGNASRFFKSIIYQAKASKSERNRGCEGLEEKSYTMNSSPKRQVIDGVQQDVDFTTKPLSNKNNHPTVKPIALMEYLIKMVTPKGGIVLDPFAGSGSTLIACKKLGRDYIGIEMEEDYIKIAEARLSAVDNK